MGLMDINDSYNWTVYDFFDRARDFCENSTVEKITNRLLGEDLSEVIETIQDSIFNSIHRDKNQATEQEIVVAAIDYLTKKLG